MVTIGEEAALRIVFFGTPEFAVPTLRALHTSRHRVAGVVTQPDRPRGRGQHLQPGPVKQFAVDAGIPILQPERLRDEAFLTRLADLNPDLGVVVAYGKILTDAVLQIPLRGLLNVHASLLPKYRGAAPVHRAVMAGEWQTGVTIMRVVKELDAGPMLATAPHAIDPDATSADVELALAHLGAEALVRSVGALADGTAVETPQDHSRATYAPKIEKSDGIIEWSSPARVIHNQIRGLDPWPHAYSDLDGERTIILRSQVDTTPEGPALRTMDRTTAGPKGPALRAVPGRIVEAEGDSLRVQTGDGLLRLLMLQREGRRPVSAREFIAGRRIRPGMTFVRGQPAR
jgi:methionyl-tRNA formyltransferase